jgi:UDP-N-acetylmuramate--alanine ligase
MRMKLPNELGPIHFIGIGGIGMSGIAELLKNLDYEVQGSDASDSANVKRLRDKGISVQVGHEARNLGDAAVVVVSTAIKRDNPELVAAREKRLPVVRRAEMLAELMRFKTCVAIAGTHGKTTTTSYGTKARMGAGEFMVVEADESDGTFLKLPADVAIVTNIDPEHLDHFQTYDAIKDAFRSFVENVPFYGFAVMCLDHPAVQELVGHITDRRVITYGENPQADVRLRKVAFEGGKTQFSVVIRDRKTGKKLRIDDLVMPMPGHHNALNACAAIAVAHELKIAPERLREALARFGGVKRRFTRTGEWNGVTVIDDYGHHPVEIAAVLRAARSAAKGQVIAVIQPHRYTRLDKLMGEFATCVNDADAVLVAPVYAAGEEPIEGVDHKTLVAQMKARGHRRALAIEGQADIAPFVRQVAKPGDYVVCLGAGSITQWAYALPDELAALS